MSSKERHGSRTRDTHAKNRSAELMRVATASLRSNWLPDVFASVFDVIALNGRGMRFHEVPREHSQALAEFLQLHVGELRRCQNRRLGSMSASFKTFLRRALARYADELSDDSGREVMFALNAIDRVFWGVSPGARGADLWPYLGMYRALLREQRPLLRGVSGHLLPRVGRAAQPARSERDFFSSLCRMQAHDGCGIEYLLCDRLGPTGAAPLAPGRRSMRVGVVAAVQHPSELSWTVDKRRQVYSVALKPEAEAAVIRRTLAGLQWLAAEGAEIVLLPELVASTALDERVREWLLACKSSKPRLVITGTYLKSVPGRRQARNRAHAVDGDGLELWYQDKMHQYNFTADHQRDGGCILADEALVEDIDVSDRSLVIVDSPLGERIAIQICEDFARTVPQKQLLVEAGVNVLLVPVMAAAKKHPPAIKTEWLKRCALDFADEVRALSLVSNSGALLCPEGRPREVSDYVCAVDSYKTKTYNSAKPFPGLTEIDAILLQVEL
ncbi:hypothetical protein ACFPN2_15725 [Steroidobacter flavus]|uniref:CN hydrolase domain-containing protein n=1 Tax=Steroidobacter flavus TaxID=1842136 RepID=A0ABV8ST46_9GAMM